MVGIVEEAIKDIPEFGALDFRTIAGTSYKIYRRTSLPKGAFRTVNTGVASSASGGTQVEVACKFFDSVISVDEAMIMGDIGLLGDMMTNEGVALLSGNLQALAEQIYYGTDESGFSGYNTLIASGMTVAANSTVESGTPYSGVYFVHTGIKGVQFVGGNSTALQLGDVYEQDISDSDGKTFRAYNQRMRGWYGLQAAATKCIGKLEKVTTELTQDMMSSLLAKFPNVVKPNAIFMNRNVFYNCWIPERAKVGLLKNGNTKLTIESNYDNAAVDSFMGIPIYVSDAIKDDETPAAG